MEEPAIAANLEGPAGPLVRETIPKALVSRAQDITFGVPSGSCEARDNQAIRGPRVCGRGSGSVRPVRPPKPQYAPSRSDLHGNWLIGNGVGCTAMVPSPA